MAAVQWDSPKRHLSSSRSAFYYRLSKKEMWADECEKGESPGVGQLVGFDDRSQLINWADGGTFEGNGRMGEGEHLPSAPCTTHTTLLVVIRAKPIAFK